ncbi:hypothetical protein BHF71_05930 [Vulcanibacillus modesticaldus]|uniref:Uncharacterized protein n=1 Tax=Vulcanibacillus modesticaldus TaxID=337097 RepID=A0A1D2YWP9_9BACI|nr:hypothetical protein [Vulcanibacillus modesticaldus]OEG00140.1 hypothetical protein BHF71_05930 [Vulcanibacillus modesticaldus]
MYVKKENLDAIEEFSNLLFSQYNIRSVKELTSTQKEEAKEMLRSSTTYTEKAIEAIVEKGIGLPAVPPPERNVIDISVPLRNDYDRINEVDENGNYIWSDEDIYAYLNSMYPSGDERYPSFPLEIEYFNKKYPLDFKAIREFGVIKWGRPEDVSEVTRFTNDYDETTEEWRFLGLSRDLYVVNNPNFPPDTNGVNPNVYLRNFINEPWEKWNTIVNYKFRPRRENYWMDSNFNNFRTNYWNLYPIDKYKELGMVSESNFEKHQLDLNKRNRIFLVETPPSHINLGMATEWHGNNGRYYDSFVLTMNVLTYDFELVDLNMDSNGLITI